MAIRIEQPGAAKAAAQTGAVIGKGERAKENRARAEREQARAQQMAAQQQARQAALQWEQEKMTVRSQLDFQKEMRAKQWEIERDDAAQQWDIDKMRLASENDFQQDEKERIRKKSTLNSGMETINNSDAPEAEKETARFRLKSKFIDVEGYENVLGLAKETQDPNIERRKQLEAIVGPEYGRSMGMTELEEEAEKETRKMGLDLGGVGQQIEGISEPIYITNPSTGEVMVSFDNEKTWQPIK